MDAMASQITSLAIVYSNVYSDADQRKHQSSASLAFVRAIHRRPVISPHKWPVTRKIFPFDDVIMPDHSTVYEGRHDQIFKIITVTPQERDGVSNQREPHCLFNLRSPRYWPFVRGIHRWTVDSIHIGPATGKYPKDSTNKRVSNAENVSKSWRQYV